MKRISLFLLMFLSLSTLWAQQGSTSTYLRGAVPVDTHGRVLFSHSYPIQGQTTAQVYQHLLTLTDSLLQAPTTLAPSQRVVSDEKQGNIVVKMYEWVVFKRNAFVLHRTRMDYNLVFSIKPQHVEMSLTNISYAIDPNEEGQSKNIVKAENWITDAEALNRKGTKLNGVSGKYRTKTIDRVHTLRTAVAHTLRTR